MKAVIRSKNMFRYVTSVLGSACAVAALSVLAHAADAPADPMPRAEGWLVKSYAEVARPAAAKPLKEELAALKATAAKRTAEDVARYKWWATGGPVHRWNELALDELQEGFVTLPLAVRHLALLHAAMDDAVAAAQHHGKPGAPRRTVDIDGVFKLAASEVASAPPASEYSAVAVTAAEVLGYLFPARAAHFAEKAEEAIRVRLLAGVELPQAAENGREIGRKVSALAIARGKSDGSGAKWSGSVPEGAGLWKGTNPIAPLAGTWQPWVLKTANELRPAAPPAIDSDQVKAALAELKGFARTPRTNHRANYWEVHGGARAHTLWNEIARTRIMEHGYPSATGSRVLAALNIALLDAGIACWDAKYAFWYIRPSQLDSDLKALFAPPNHPSYPAAHGCFSTAAATVLARVFPQDRDRLLALGEEAAEARVWAGIHYRFDIDAGQEIGRKVGERTLERAFMAQTTGQTAFAK
ncbi:phosphatase PAP2 family protein [Bradyrhizobium sp.]|uniref:phosphatase PAP2 family protein n=1 Tax=Bradyrhizobium sp. TaxID=376 RepID=UPI0025C27A13|nr:phosphatase PAP2 family protein [Bradyrhizobium sp.]